MTTTQSTNRMTGGALPAMTWHDIMAYAHQGIEIKQLPGIPVPPVRQQPVIAENKSKSSEPPPPRPTVLTKRGADILVRVERMMDDANRAMGPLRPTVSTDKEKQAQAPQKGDALAVALGGACVRQPELISRLPAAGVVSLTRINVPITADRSCGCFSDRCLPLSSPPSSVSARLISRSRAAPPSVALTIGSWTAWPKTGTVDADPYARAAIARIGRLPIALGDGVSFTALSDDNGRLLDGRCDVDARRHHAGGAVLDADALQYATVSWSPIRSTATASPARKSSATPTAVSRSS